MAKALVAEARLSDNLALAIASRAAKIGVCGLGYVGLPLAMAVRNARYRVVGFDVDQGKVEKLNAGQSYLGTVSPDIVRKAGSRGLFEATTDLSRLAECDIIIVCVPTPLTAHREPDLSFVESTARSIKRTLRPGQLIVLESTSYPGTTSQVFKPILERNGFRSGVDFFLGFSPEREDPGNADFQTKSIPKIVAGDGEDAKKLTAAFYSSVVDRVVSVSTMETAEAVKVTENIFRAVNIALVNELKLIYGSMDIDIWEVIEAAKTKPFGYMPFYPGPGLGGHCIPIDPFYLTWKAREHGVPTRFIELAGEINTSMPRHVVSKLEEALDHHSDKTLGRSSVLLLGMAYKRNIADIRESPALKLIELIEARGGRTSFHDPHVAEVPPTREHPKLRGRRSLDLTSETIAAHDAVIIVTDHDAIDYRLLASARIIVDTRNACASRGLTFERTVKA